MTSPRQFLRQILTQDDIASLIYLEVLFGILFSIWSLIAFLYITNAVVHKETVFWDNYILQTVLLLRATWLTPVMLFMSFLGSEAVVFGSIVVILFLSLKKHRRETFIFSILLLLGVVATTFLKLSYEVPRPSVLPLAIERSYSYPSGHALNSLLFYSTISYFIYHLTKDKKKAIISFTITGILIGLIGLSRVYLGVHYPSDLLAGYIAGFWLFITAILIDRTVMFFKLIRETPTNQ